MSQPFLRGCESAIRLMATTLLISPAIDPDRLCQCVDRWREQRVADVAIDEFGDAARKEARDRLHAVAGDAALAVPLPPTQARLARVSGKPMGQSHAA